jgi:hypothetical protein
MKAALLVLLECLLVGVAAGYEESETGLRAGRFVLAPTLSAPAQASGLVEFGGASGGVNTLSVKTQELGPGLYWLVLVRHSDGAALQLGPLPVPDPDYQPDRQAGNDFKERSSAHQATPLATQSTVTLPSGWDPADIAQLVVTDLDGNPLLTGRPTRL